MRMKRPLAPTVTEASMKRRRALQEELFHPSQTESSRSYVCSSALAPHLGTFGQVSALSQFLRSATNLPAAATLVANIMDNQLAIPDAQYSGLRILVHWGPSSLGATHFVECFMKAMRSHLGNPMIHLEACQGLLRWMREDEKVLEEVESAECLSLLMKSLDYHSDSRQMRYTVLDIVRGIIGCSKERRSRISTQENVTSCIVRILKKTILDALTQQIGLSILSWITEEQASRNVIVRGGGFEHLLDAMRLHPWDDTVQCNAAATLCWLIHTSGHADSSLLGVRSLVVVTDTMKRFLLNPMVFGNCLCALSGAMVNRSHENSFYIPGLEIAEMTLTGMRIHRASPKVHRNGLTLLRFLVINGSEGEDVGTAILNNINVLQASIRAQPDDPALQVEAYGMLAHLSSRSEEARELVIGSGCVEAVVQSQMKHRNHLRVQQNALWFHNCLLRDRRLSEAEEAFGGGIQVLATMTTGISLPEVNDDIV